MLYKCRLVPHVMVWLWWPTFWTHGSDQWHGVSLWSRSRLVSVCGVDLQVWSRVPALTYYTTWPCRLDPPGYWPKPTCWIWPGARLTFMLQFQLCTSSTLCTKPSCMPPCVSYPVMHWSDLKHGLILNASVIQHSGPCYPAHGASHSFRSLEAEEW